MMPGLIHLILPNAKIIDIRSAPLACCFSNLKQLFASGQQFTYSIEDITRYYRMYVDLMEHFDTALPGKILRVTYENLVEDQWRHFELWLGPFKAALGPLFEGA